MTAFLSCPTDFSDRSWLHCYCCFFSEDFLKLFPIDADIKTGPNGSLFEQIWIPTFQEWSMPSLVQWFQRRLKSILWTNIGHLYHSFGLPVSLRVFRNICMMNLPMKMNQMKFSCRHANIFAITFYQSSIKLANQVYTRITCGSQVLNTRDKKPSILLSCLAEQFQRKKNTFF